MSDPESYEDQQNIPEDVRQEVLERDNGQCQIDGDNTVELHHVQYRSQGGEHTSDNILSVSPERHREIHEGEIEIIEFEPNLDQLTVARRETGELVEPLWWYDKPERSADEAHTIRQTITVLREEETKNRLTIGRALTRVEDGELYRSLDYDSFEAFLGDPEVDLGRSTAYRYMKVYRRFILRADVDPNEVVAMGIRKASMIARYVKDPREDLQEWIEKAKALSRSDLQAEIDEAEGNDTANGENGDSGDSRLSEPGWVTRIRNYTQDLREDPEDVTVLTAIRDIVEGQLEEINASVGAGD